MRGNQPLRNLNRDLKRAQRRKRKAREAQLRAQWAEWRLAAKGKDPIPFNKWRLNDEAEAAQRKREQRLDGLGFKGRYARGEFPMFVTVTVSQDTWNYGLTLLKRALTERSK